MTSKRYNQHIAKSSRFHGSEDQDLGDKLKVMRIMRDLGYASTSNMYMIVPRDPEKQEWRLTELVSNAILHDWKLVARPDVACIKDGHFELLVEIDGNVHKSHDTRPLYDELGIKYVIVNKWFLETEGISWKDWIIAELGRITEDASA